MSPTSYRAAPSRVNNTKGGCGIRTHARFYTPDGFQDRSLQPDLGNPPNYNSPYGIRTRVTAVKRRCLNPLTNGPYYIMGTSGLEPPTSRLSGVRSNHLSYAPKLKNLVEMNISSKRVTRIELATTAWKAVVLPLNYTRIFTILMGVNGIEPLTLCL